jgi:SAM-dependent methyltransferase
MSRSDLGTRFSPPVFDAAAESYDEAFTHTRLGRWLRDAVWARVGPLFRPGQRVLELGCGTGEDALWLARQGVQVVATDVSAAMMAIARAKAARAGLSDYVTFARLDLAAPQAADAVHVWDTLYDGVLSNFGALNCLSDRAELASPEPAYARRRPSVCGAHEPALRLGDRLASIARAAQDGFAALARGRRGPCWREQALTCLVPLSRAPAARIRAQLPASLHRGHRCVLTASLSGRPRGSASTSFRAPGGLGSQTCPLGCRGAF